MRPLRLLFVCTGNTCRSPLAEVIARAEADRRGWAGADCRSAGSFAMPGLPAAGHGVEVARERGLDLGSHRARLLDFDMLAGTDLVLGMTPAHLDEIRCLHPGVRSALVTDFLPEDHPDHDRGVADPVGGPRSDYEDTYRILEASIRGLFDRLEGGWLESISEEGPTVRPDEGSEPGLDA